MFINMSSMKAIVFDLDSIPLSNEFDWSRFTDSIDVLIISKRNKRELDNLKIQNPRFLVKYGIQLSASNTDTNIKSINVIKDLLGLKIHQFAIITGKRNLVMELQKLPLNIIEYNENDYNAEDDDYQNVADFQIKSEDDLHDIIKCVNIGYLSEFICQQVNVKKSSIKCRELLKRNLKTTDDKPVKVIAGGRYYPKKDARSHIHLLSWRINWNKKEIKSQFALFVKIYSDLVEHVQRSVNPVDSICYVPNRPSEIEYDRFQDIVSEISVTHQINNIGSLLHCKRDYGEQKHLNSQERVQNIKDVFSFSGNGDLVRGNHIVVIDDLFVTGATTLELSSKLYELGAKQVTVVVLALNQMGNDNNASFNTIYCKCGAKFVARVKMESDLECFFGCEKYSIKTEHNSYNYSSGLLNVFEENNKIIEGYDGEQKPISF